MNFRHTIAQFSPLLFVSQDVEYCSSLGRSAMLNENWMNSIDEINKNLDKVEKFYKYLSHPDCKKGIDELEIYLSELVDIKGSIQILKVPGAICTDIDFFEIKKLALIEEKVSHLCDSYGIELEGKPSLSPVLELLDPESQRLPSFYLAPVFEPQLGSLRKAQSEASDDELGLIASKLSILEDEVRGRLTHLLSPYSDTLQSVLNAFAQDILALGKAKWAIKIGAKRPLPKNEGESILMDVFHPEVKASLCKQKMVFQPVSFRFLSEPTLITGANMAGKSVLLSSIALAQILMQYGWFVPANVAELVTVDEVMLSSGDGQDISNGLSSFGSEMMRLDTIIREIKKGKQVLALIDEPARSTNPTEGHALVNGLVKLLNSYKVRAIITTHYSNISSGGKRWRVKGFVEEKLKKPLSVNQLNHCIDYSLEEDIHDTVPQEAFRIARILGVDEELLEMCIV